MKIIKILSFYVVLVVLAANTYAVDWPVPEKFPFPKNISSDFGPRNVSTGSKMHDGIDFKVDDGVEVKSITKGTVKHAGEMSGWGYTVIIEKDNLSYIYGHLYHPKGKNTPDEYKTPLFYGNENISKGQIIGHADSTGISSGPHLHLTVAKNLGKKNQEKFNPLKLGIFNYTAKPPSITKVVIQNEKGEGISRYEDGRYYLLRKYKSLNIEATVEDTEKDLNEVSFSSSSKPPLDCKFEYPTNGFKAYTLKDGVISKKGLPIKVKPGNVDTKNKSSDIFIFDRSIRALQKKEFNLKIEAKDIKDKSSDKSFGFYWEANAIVRSRALKDSQGATIETYTKDQPVIEATLVPEESEGIFIPDHYSWSSILKLYSNPQVIEPEITFSEDGSEATINHQTSGLEDGPHTAVIEIVDENGNVTDSMQKILITIHGCRLSGLLL